MIVAFAAAEKIAVAATGGTVVVTVGGTVVVDKSVVMQTTCRLAYHNLHDDRRCCDLRCRFAPAPPFLNLRHCCDLCNPASPLRVTLSKDGTVVYQRTGTTNTYSTY